MNKIAAVVISLFMVLGFAAPASAATGVTKYANSSSSNCSFYAKGPGAAQVTIKPGASRTATFNHYYIPKNCVAMIRRGLGPSSRPPSGKWVHSEPNAWKTWVFSVSKK